MIAALASAEGQPNAFVPWRDSKLTRLLQNTLGGPARTALLITVRPDDANIQESTTSLMFGQRAREVTDPLPARCIDPATLLGMESEGASFVAQVVVDPLQHPAVDYRALASELQGDTTRTPPCPPQDPGWTHGAGHLLAPQGPSMLSPSIMPSSAIRNRTHPNLNPGPQPEPLSEPVP